MRGDACRIAVGEDDLDEQLRPPVRRRASALLIAIALTGGCRRAASSTSPSLGGAVLLAGWIGAWFVIGFSILPYVTVVPARWLIAQRHRPVHGRVRQRRRRPDRRPVIGLLLGLPLANLPDAVQLAAADRHGRS